MFPCSFSLETITVYLVMLMYVFVDYSNNVFAVVLVVGLYHHPRCILQQQKHRPHHFPQKNFDVIKEMINIRTYFDFGILCS